MIKTKKSLKVNLGFTLAEVLITLAIIGVVAALTIPTLISVYKKHAIETQLKETYSLLQNSIKMSSIENGSPTSWNDLTTDDDTIFDKYFMPYIKVTEKCSYTQTTNECRHKIYNYNDLSTPSYNLNNSKYLLSNGVGVIYRGASSTTVARKGIFIVDLSNGKGDKLIFGKNAFVFNLVFANNTYFITSTKDYDANTKSFCSDYTKAQKQDFCLNGSGGYGYAEGVNCTALIECNNWQIPDDYPINF